MTLTHFKQGQLCTPRTLRGICLETDSVSPYPAGFNSLTAEFREQINGRERERVRQTSGPSRILSVVMTDDV